MQIDLEFKTNFWPSNSGGPIGHLNCNIYDAASEFCVPVFLEGGAQFVLLQFEALGPVSFYKDPETELVQIVVDDGLNPIDAARELSLILEGRLEPVWPNGWRKTTTD